MESLSFVVSAAGTMVLVTRMTDVRTRVYPAIIGLGHSTVLTAVVRGLSLVSKGVPTRAESLALAVMKHTGTSMAVIGVCSSMSKISGTTHAFPGILMSAFVLHQGMSALMTTYDGMQHTMGVLLMGLGLMGYFDQCPVEVARSIMMIGMQVAFYLVAHIITTNDMARVIVDAIGIMIIDQVIDVLSMWDAYTQQPK